MVRARTYIPLLRFMIKDAGFEHVRETKRFLTVFGALSLYSGRRPA